MCERDILASRHLPPWEIFDTLSWLTRGKGPRLNQPQEALLPLGYLNQWLAEYVTNRARRHSTLGYLSPVEFEEGAAHSTSGVY